MKTDLDPPDSKSESMPPGRLPEVQEQIEALGALDRENLLAHLRKAAREKDTRPEVLLHFARIDHGDGNQEVRLAAFEALVRVATPMLHARMSQMYGMSLDDIQDHQNLVFEDLYRRVVRKDAGLEYGVRRFGSFLLRRSLDAMKSRHHPWAPSIKKVMEKIEWYRGGESIPSYDCEAERLEPGTDPRRHSAALDPEARAEAQDELDALEKRVGHLPEKAYKAFLMSRVLRLTQAQISEHFGVTDRTVREWIKSVAEVLDHRKVS